MVVLPDPTGAVIVITGKCRFLVISLNNRLRLRYFFGKIGGSKRNLLLDLII